MTFGKKNLLPGLIAYCGIDGSGKTTQLGKLAEWLRANGREVVATRQPTDFYRQHPSVVEYFETGRSPNGMYELVLLSALDRQVHLREVIEPAIRDGAVVLTDRYYYSAEAFFFARGMTRESVRQANASVPIPQMTVFLDLPAEVCHRRIISRGKGWSSQEERRLDFLEKVREGFLGAQDESYFVVDARLPIDDIAHIVQKCVRSLKAPLVSP